MVLTAEHDPLRDEGEAYARRLAADGVRVEHRRFTSQMHGFFMLVGLVPGSAEAIDYVADAIDRELSGAPLAALSSPRPQQFDAIVVGAGFAGLYALHRLRGLGLQRARARAGRRRRRHLVLEPLSRRALRHRVARLLVLVLGGA